MNKKKFFTKLKYIVVGTGRCGTVSMAKLLTDAGIPCSHERIFTSAGLDYARNVLLSGEGEDSEAAQRAGLNAIDPVIAEASYMAVPYLNHHLLKKASIIHLVRDPIDVILSWNNNMQRWHHLINEPQHYILWHMLLYDIPKPITTKITPLISNTYFVIMWNRWIEKQAEGRRYIRVRIEFDIPKLLNFLNIKQSKKMEITNKTNALWPPLKELATSTDILNGPFGEEIKKLKSDYGYV